MKIIASDFDGTFRRHGEVSESDLAAVKKWQEAGNLFGFSTGRGYCSIRETGERYGVDFIVCGGGGALYSGDGKLLWEKTYGREELQMILDIADRVGIPNCASYYDAEKWILRSGFEKFPMPEDLQRVQVSSFFSPEKERCVEFASEVNRLIPDHARAHLNGKHIDLVAGGVTKSWGIRALMEHYSVKEEDVITVGDNLNDYDMIKDFGGVTVPNGVDAIKAVATRVYNDFTELVEDNL